MSILINASDKVQFHNPASLSFNGSTEYIDCTTVAEEVSIARGTVSAWVKLDSTSINGVIFKASVDANNNVTMNYNNSSQKIQMQYKAGGTAKVADASFAFEGNDTWYHLCMTWDTGADELKGYIDGTQIDSTLSSLGTWSGTIDTVMSAKNSLANNSYWSGHITHLAVFDGVVSPTLLYNGGTPGNLNGLSGLKMWFTMREQSGTSVADYSGTGNTGTLYNTPTWTTDTP
tara:strand:- start:647 stop:1339 length:693 start_codon:yes stop_codon:yes gene_type:complete